MSSPIQRSFSGGEVSPAMRARADLAAYGRGLQTARNVTVMKTGGVQNRPGTEYLGSTKADGVARLVEATFDDDEGYVLEFGNLYVRPWLDGAPVSGLTAVAWLTATAYTQGWLVTNGGNTYVCLVAHTSGTFATDLAAGKWYSLGATATAVYEYPTPYTTAQLPQMSEQAKVTELNVVTVVHPAHAPAILTRMLNPTTGAAASEYVWVLTEIEFAGGDATRPDNIAVSGTAGTGFGYTVTSIFAADEAAYLGGFGTESSAGAFVRTNITGSVLEVGVTLAASPRTITWDAVPGAYGYLVYGIEEGGYGWLINVLPVTTNTLVDNGAWTTFPVPSSPPTTVDGFDAAGEYPAVVGSYQQRLLLAGSTDAPDVVNASRTAFPYDFNVSDPIVDSDAMSWRQILSGGRLNRVRDIVEFAERLAVLSSAAETLVQGDGVILRPGEVNPRVISQNGSATIPRALIVGDTALYVSRGNVVRDLVPSQQGVLGSDVSLMAAHLFRGHTVLDWCYQQTPDSVVWLVRDDGVLLSCTYVREAGIIGWCRHDTDGEYESVACVSEDERDVVYAVVKRTINSATVRYIERFTDRLADVPVLMDSAKVAYAPVAASLTQATSGLRAYNVRTADIVSGISTAFVAGDWTGQNLGSGSISLNGNGDLVFNKNGVSGLHWGRYTPESFSADGVVLASIVDASTGAGIGVGARFSTETPPQESVVASIPVGFSGNYELADTTGGVASGSSTTAGYRATSDISRIALSVEGTEAEARLQTVNGTSGALDPTLTLSTIGAAGTFCGVQSSSGTTGNLTVTYRQFAVLEGRALTVNGPATGNWRIRLRDAGGSVILTSGLQSGGVATIDLLDNRDTWLGASAASLLSLATQIEIYDDDAAAVVAGPETPGERLWGGDVWTFVGATGFDGLGHLEGESVSVITLAGETLASPYNPAYDAVTVTDGSVTLPDGTGDVWVGLPYVSDIQTLDLDSASVTRKDTGMNIKRVGLWLEDSDTPYGGNTAPTSLTSIADLQKVPRVDDDGNATTDNISGFREGALDGMWNTNGRVFLRHVDPTPLTVLAITPSGDFGGR